MYRLYLLLFIALAITGSLAVEVNTSLSEFNNDNQATHSIEQTNENQIVENEFDLINDNYIKYQNNDKIKKALDHFTMERRKTHFQVPVSLLKNIDLKSNIIHKRDVKQFNAFEDPANSYFYKDPKLFNILRKQTVLMSKLLQILEDEKDVKRNGKKKKRVDPFDELLKQIDFKQQIPSQEEVDIGTVVQNHLIFHTTATPPTTKIWSTVMTMVDETEVRRALKNDPLIKRILKLASRKREKYFQSVKNSVKTI